MYQLLPSVFLKYNLVDGSLSALNALVMFALVTASHKSNKIPLLKW